MRKRSRIDFCRVRKMRFARLCLYAHAICTTTRRDIKQPSLQQRKRSSTRGMRRDACSDALITAEAIYDTPNMRRRLISGDTVVFKRKTISAAAPLF